MHSRDMEKRQGCGRDTVGSSKIEYGVFSTNYGFVRKTTGSGFWFDVQEEWRWNTVEAL